MSAVHKCVCRVTCVCTIMFSGNGMEGEYAMFQDQIGFVFGITPGEVVHCDAQIRLAVLG